MWPNNNWQIPCVILSMTVQAHQQKWHCKWYVWYDMCHLTNPAAAVRFHSTIMHDSSKICEFTHCYSPVFPFLCNRCSNCSSIHAKLIVIISCMWQIYTCKRSCQRSMGSVRTMGSEKLRQIPCSQFKILEKWQLRSSSLSITNVQKAVKIICTFQKQDTKKAHMNHKRKGDQ